MRQGEAVEEAADDQGAQDDAPDGAAAAEEAHAADDRRGDGVEQYERINRGRRGDLA